MEVCHTKDGKTYTRKYNKRRSVSKFDSEYKILAQDIAIRTYFADLSTPDKPLSNYQKTNTYRSILRFLTRLNRPITGTAVSELIKFKRENPNDFTLEQAEQTVLRQRRGAKRRRQAAVLREFLE